MKLRGFAVYESCGYVMFENRFRAKKVAVTFVQCSETLEVKWITPKVLLPIASAYLEPISEEEWASIVEHLPDWLGQFRTPEMKLRGFAVYESPRS